MSFCRIHRVYSNGIGNMAEENIIMDNGYEDIEKVEGTVDVEGKSKQTLAILALIIGILALVCCCFKYVQLIFGIAAVVLGILSIKNGETDGKAMAIIGIVCGGLGILLGVLGMIIGAALVAAFKGASDILGFSSDELGDILNNL